MASEKDLRIFDLGDEHAPTTTQVEDRHEEDKWRDVRPAEPTFMGTGGLTSFAPEPPPPRHRGLWFVLGLTLAALAASWIYGYGTLRTANIRLDQLPQMLRSLTSATNRLDAAEASIRDWASNWAMLSDRVVKLEHSVSLGLARARRHADDLVAASEKRINARLDERSQTLQAKIDELESAQQAQAAALSQVKDEIGTVKQELASVKEQSDAKLVALGKDVSGQGQELVSINRQLEIKRVNFEARRNKVEEATSEISLKVTKTNGKRQRFSGWVLFKPDERTVWVRNHAAQAPLTIYSKDDARRYEVVVTTIRRNTVSGYVLEPAETGGKETAAHPEAAGVKQPAGD